MESVIVLRDFLFSFFFSMYSAVSFYSFTGFFGANAEGTPPLGSEHKGARVAEPGLGLLPEREQ